MKFKGSPIICPEMEVEGELYVDCLVQDGEVIPTDKYYIGVDTAKENDKQCISYYRVNKDEVTNVRE